MSTQRWNAVVIGTGFGGSTTALKLARAGMSVLVLERGRWVDRDDSAWDAQTILLDQKYQSTTPYVADNLSNRTWLYPNAAVGGASVFYGAASFRLREGDFERRSRFADQSPPDAAFADWPISYADLSPYYDEAEQLLGVLGVAGTDPTEPPRGADYCGAPPPYAPPARRVAAAARQLGLQPFPIPLAINYHDGNHRAKCIQCPTCDLFPCKIGAKNDLSVTVLPEAISRGAVVKDQTVATKLVTDDGGIAGVECVDLRTGKTFTASGDVVVVSAGAIASARLLLASGLDRVEPNGRLVGRYLMRHCSGIVLGFFLSKTNPEQLFHKQVAITDFYFGHPSRRPPAGPWGMIQGLQVPPREYMVRAAPFLIGHIGYLTQAHQIYLICIAEDMPRFDSRVTLHPTRQDIHGQPIAHVSHRYHRRDLQGRKALYREAARIMRKAGAWARGYKHIDTFSHAMGTCRFGTDPATAVLDPWCRFFGIPNLYVVDGSFMPTSGGVNPSLTIAANGLRVAEHIAREWTESTGEGAS